MSMDQMTLPPKEERNEGELKQHRIHDGPKWNDELGGETKKVEDFRDSGSESRLEQVKKSISIDL